MNENRGRNRVTTSFMFPYVAVLALAALLFCLLALHSEMTAHDQPMAGSSMAATAAVTADAGAAAAGATAAVLVDLLADGERFGVLDCALLGMACVLMLVLVVPVFLTRWPAVFRRPGELSDARLRIVSVVAVPVPTPSLSALSVLRV